MPRDLGATNQREVSSAVSVWEAEGSAAFFCGVRHFTSDDTIAEVPFASDDAVDLAWLFSRWLGLVKTKAVTLCLSGEPQKTSSQNRLAELLDMGATVLPADQSTLLQGLIRSCAVVSERGLLIVSFATHGCQLESQDYLLACSSLRSRVMRTGIPVADIVEELRASRAKRQILLLDCCRERFLKGSRAIHGSVSSDAFVSALASARGEVVLSAAAPGGFAYDDAERGNGVFTATLIEGLLGSAPADGRGFITPQQLAGWMNREITEWTRLNRGPDCRGGIAYHVAGDAANMPLAVHPEAEDSADQFRRRLHSARLRLEELVEFDPTFASASQIIADRLLQLEAGDAPLLAMVERANHNHLDSIRRLRQIASSESRRAMPQTSSRRRESPSPDKTIPSQNPLTIDGKDVTHSPEYAVTLGLVAINFPFCAGIGYLLAALGLPGLGHGVTGISKEGAWLVDFHSVGSALSIVLPAILNSIHSFRKPHPSLVPRILHGSAGFLLSLSLLGAAFWILAAIIYATIGSHLG